MKIIIKTEMWKDKDRAVSILDRLSMFTFLISGINAIIYGTNKYYWMMLINIFLCLTTGFIMWSKINYDKEVSKDGREKERRFRNEIKESTK